MKEKETVTSSLDKPVFKYPDIWDIHDKQESCKEKSSFLNTCFELTLCPNNFFISWYLSIPEMKFSKAKS